MFIQKYKKIANKPFKVIHVVYLKVNLKNKRALLPIHN